VAVADRLAAQNVSAEVIDLRSLWPWDKASVLASVRKTGRLVVAHESVAVGGFGAEVIATVAEQAGDALRGPLRRLGAPRSLVAYAPNLEDRVRVTQDMIEKAAIETLGKSAP
jgi:pyruvate dehydrogenase E1 component beta subunit